MLTRLAHPLRPPGAEWFPTKKESVLSFHLPTIEGDMIALQEGHVILPEVMTYYRVHWFPETVETLLSWVADHMGPLPGKDTFDNDDWRVIFCPEKIDQVLSQGLICVYIYIYMEPENGTIRDSDFGNQ